MPEKLTRDILWEWSHRYLKIGFGIDPIDVLRSSMGSIPQASFSYLWDQSHKCPQVTYGIYPKNYMRNLLGTICENSPTGTRKGVMVFSSHLWDWSHKSIRNSSGTVCENGPISTKNGLWDRSHMCRHITYGFDPIGLIKSCLGLIPSRETHQEQFVRMVP